MAEWHEFRLWFKNSKRPADDMFTFKQKHILPILERYEIEDFLMLDEPEFMLLRINTNDESSSQIYSDLEKVMLVEPFFSKVTVESWFPAEDAKNRILTAREKAKLPAGIPEGGWMIKGKTPNGYWAAAPQDLGRQVEAFSVFMAKVAGRFTKAYLKEMTYRVEDRWLMSVFLHLLLDSISTWQQEEDEIREFPYI
jgi:hypothetical protein